ncbi:type II toxin-antitoxin system HicA family toxin [Burkholderia ubonensis]|uniref:type II toxin-antitoxin system HicA family toxin n=1 Tax=Burkholderia ubonensis TaxID=101571 RepID=UPI0007C752BA|nr:type II toxin-antitoxin system HicA family toxin [Burkholderia ubonensis]
MSTLEKLRKRIVRIPADFAWDEMVTLLKGLGFKEKTKKGGSYRTFFDDAGRKIFVHKPHPGSIVKVYSVRDVVEKLREFGLLEDEDEE